MTERNLTGRVSPATGILAEGLSDFYSRQAEMLLAEYESINLLLGPTTDWSHPGTLCEILLRDFLRQHLLPSMGVDKGYIYGRVNRGGIEQHCPEVDILVHDVEKYRPVYRLGDFVIVQPEAVLAIIQVKRTFWPGKDGSLIKGIKQAVKTRQHLLDMMVATNAQGCGYPTWPDMKHIFSAVVAFEDATDGNPETYRQCLLEQYRESHAHADSRCEHDTGVYILPNFVGSLKGIVAMSAGANMGERQYWILKSVQPGRNLALLWLLAAITDRLWDIGQPLPPFPAGNCTEKVGATARSEDLLIGVIQVPRPSESLHRRELAEGQPAGDDDG